MVTRIKTERPQLDPSIVAALHQSGGVWRAVVGRPESGQLAIQQTKDFPDAQPETVDAWLDEHHVGRVILVLPAGTVICRSCPLPDAGSQQLDTALRLQAESQLLGTAPPHRQAMAVLHAAPGEPTRSGLILAWPEGNEPAIPTNRQDVTFSADIAAIAALLNGTRPNEPLLWADGVNGAVSFAMTHPSGTTFRATRENIDSPEYWREGVTRTLAETALNAGHTPEYIDELRRSIADRFDDQSIPATVLWLPDEVREQIADRIDRTDMTAQWWNAYGIAAGVLLTQADHLASLASLQRKPPEVNPSTMERLVASLSTPQTAIVLTVIAGVLALCSPLLVHGARYAVLQSKLSDLEANRDEVDSLDRQIAMYEAMQERSWPMTKIISDIVNNAPQGVDLESINVTFSEGDAITINGQVAAHDGRSPQEIANQMEERLQSTGIFQHPRANLDQPNVHGDQYRLRLNAYVNDALRIRDYDESEDFAKVTLRHRLYPELLEQEGRSENAPRAGDPGDGDSSRRSSPPDRNSDPGRRAASGTPERPDQSGDEQADSGDGERDGERRTARRGDRPDSPFSNPARPRSSDGGRRSEGDDTEYAGTHTVPDALSSEQVQAMSPDEARRLMAEYARAMQLPNLDDETSERLREDFRKLQLRAREGNR